ncbi:MAG: hypothetical protein ACRDQT_11475 [Gaiellaceae bacterium]
MSSRRDRFGRARESSAAGRWLAATVAALGLALAGVSCTGSTNGSDGQHDAGGAPPPAGDPQPSVAPSASGLRAEYRRAVARMTRTNHLLEKRQADLYFATRDGAPAVVLADLRREVASLERKYAKGIEAMNEALRCEGSDCPGRG